MTIASSAGLSSTQDAMRYYMSRSYAIHASNDLALGSPKVALRAHEFVAQHVSSSADVRGLHTARAMGSFSCSNDILPSAYNK